MNDAVGGLLSERIADHLDALERTLASLTVLAPTEHQRSAVASAVHRARAALQAAGEPMLVIALAGGTGVGKSTVINALAGAPIAEVSDRRPTTDVAVVYVHRAVPAALLPTDLGPQVRTVTHDRAELRHKVIIDTPDLDSVRTAHRAYTRRLLSAADLVLLVTTGEKYYDEKVWSVIDEEQAFKPLAVLLNKIDLLPQPGDRQAIAEDLQQILKRQGLNGAQVYRLHGAFHAADVERRGAQPADGDQFDELTAWIQRGLLQADIEGIKRRQATAVVEHLHRQVHAIMPGNPAAEVERATAGAHAEIGRWTESLLAGYDRALLGIESALRPVITVAAHERFNGLFRAYLAVVDGARFGLRWLLKTLLGRADRSVRDVLIRGLSGTQSRLEGSWADARSAICQAFARSGLPSIVLEDRLSELSAEQLTQRLESAVVQLAEDPHTWALKPRPIRLAAFNFVAAVLPIAFLCVVGWRLGVEFYYARYASAPALVSHALALLVLGMLALHGLSAILFPIDPAGACRRIRERLGQLIAVETAEWLEEPMAAFRNELLADCRGLSDRLGALRGDLQRLGESGDSASGSS